MAEQRTWGDGGGDQRVHVIEHISFVDDIIGCRCGSAVRGGAVGLDAAWNAHGGKVLPHAGQPASDGEVHDFLARIGTDLDGDKRHRQARATAMPLPVESQQAAVDSAFEWLDTVTLMQERCTCATTAVEDCPNYVEGDENE